jgi:hypothetical protein
LRPPDTPVRATALPGDPTREGLSKCMLGATLDSLRRGLAEINKLRQEAVKLHVCSKSPVRHSRTPLQQRASPLVAMQESDHAAEQLEQGEGVGASDSHLPPPRL